MVDESWQLKQGDRLVGTLILEEIDMSWSDCRFEPAPAWEDLRPLFAVSRDAWVRGDQKAARAADEAIRTAGLVLVPSGGGDPITDLLIRINGETARFRH
ncbi:hypothetical protein [Kitasatospora purpeofusca]|uniref:hypothetical protein n=1 Tax=Kitasatospora purpeofusca TaxID=67352 RepID=UPI003F4AADD9